MFIMNVIIIWSGPRRPPSAPLRPEDGSVRFGLDGAGSIWFNLLIYGENQCPYIYDVSGWVGGNCKGGVDGRVKVDTLCKNSQCSISWLIFSGRKKLCML